MGGSYYTMCLRVLIKKHDTIYASKWKFEWDLTDFIYLQYPTLLENNKFFSSIGELPMEPISKKWLKYSHTPNKKI